MTTSESLINAEITVKPYLLIFKRCYDDAIKKYNDWLLLFNEPMFNRTKAIMFQNIIVNLIKQEFEGNKSILVIEKYESLTVIIDQYVCARFKKFNSKGLPSNVRTARNSAIIGQQLVLEFADSTPLARIDVGYKLDQTGTGFELLKVICRKNKETIWDLYFHDIDSDTKNTGLEININPAAPKDDNQGGRVKFPKENKKISNG